MKKKIIISLVIVWLITLILFVIKSTGVLRLFTRIIFMFPYFVIFLIVIVISIKKIIANNKRKKYDNKLYRDILFLIILFILECLIVFDFYQVTTDILNGPTVIIVHNAKITTRRTIGKYKIRKNNLVFDDENNERKSIRIRDAKLKEKIEKILDDGCVFKVYYYENLNEISDIEILENDINH